MKFALFHVNAGPKSGLGHLMRCASYSQAFRRLGWTSHLICFDTLADKTRAIQSFDQILVCAENNINSFLDSRNVEYSVLIVDSYEIKRSTCADLFKKFPNMKIFYIDDALEKSKFPGQGLIHLGGFKKLDREAHQFKKLFFGLSYYPLGEQWNGFEEIAKVSEDIETFSVVLGGGKIKDDFLKIVDFLNSVDSENCQLFIGPFSKKENFQLNRNWKVFENVSDFPERISKSDLVLCSGGVVSFELASIGVPLLILPLSPDQASASMHFSQNDTAIVLPSIQKISKKQLREAYESLRPKHKRQALSKKLRSMVPQDGALRLVREVIEASA